MLRFLGILFTGLLTAFPEQTQPPDGREAAEKVIDRAIEAQGGPQKVARLQSVTFKARATMYITDPPVSYMGTYFANYPDCFREEISTVMDGQAHRIVKVIKGELSSMRIDANEVSPVNPASAQLERDRLRRCYYENLLPLKDKDVALRLAEPAELDGRKAVAVEYRTGNQTPHTLYFDEQTGLLLKTVVKGLNASAGVPRISEMRFSDYKKADGVLYPSRQSSYKDGKLIAEFEISELMPGVAHPADIFVCP
jgi:hypothetical protein